MAGIKKLMAVGLALSLAFPTMVYATESKSQSSVYEYESKEIKNESDQTVGYLVCTTTTKNTDFVKELELTATILDADKKTVKAEMLEGATYSWVDPYAEEAEGEESSGSETEDATKQETYTVKESGTYLVKVDLTNAHIDWALSSKVIELSVTVGNVDVTGPEILKVTQSPEGWTKDKVTITVECADYQPTMTSAEAAAVASGAPTTLESMSENAEKKTGSGLHAKAYSFDGGSTWTDKNTYEVTENTSFSFVVRDALGNQTSQTIEVKNIDKTVPTASLAVSDGELYEGEKGIVTLTATASDAESGLHEKPYSWDNGKNWYAGPSATVPTIGTYSVLVRDKAGNTATANVTVTYSEKETESEPETQPDSEPETNSTTGGSTSGTTGGSTSGTTGGSTSGTTGGNTSGATSGSTGGTTSGNTGSSSGSANNSMGNSDWDDNNHISGIVNTPSRETDETETETETETESETETKETKQTKQTKETETKEVLQTPVTEEDDDFNLPIGLILIIAAILIVLSIIVLVIKMMMDRHAAAVAEEEEEDMSKVYARVNKEASKTMAEAAAATEAAATVQKTAESEAEMHMDDMEVEAAIGASVAAAIASEEPVVKKVQRTKHEQATGVEGAEAATEATVGAEAIVNPEDEISIGEFAAAAVAAGIAVVDDEKEMEAAISEMEEEKAAHMAGAAGATESVVIEGEHSRLIIDPETGEYKYEFK